MTKKKSQPRTTVHTNAKLFPYEVRRIRAAIARGVSCLSLSKKYEVSRQVIYKIRDGLTYKSVADE